MSITLPSDSGSVTFTVFCFFLGHLDLSLKSWTIWALEMTPSKLDQEPKTVAAWADLSDKECWSLEMATGLYLNGWYRLLPSWYTYGVMTKGMSDATIVYAILLLLHHSSFRARIVIFMPFSMTTSSTSSHMPGPFPWMPDSSQGWRVSRMEWMSCHRPPSFWSQGYIISSARFIPL